jgi:hypothetical protein
MSADTAGQLHIEQAEADNRSNKEMNDVIPSANQYSTAFW